MLSRCNGHETEISSLTVSFHDRNLKQLSTKVSSRVFSSKLLFTDGEARSAAV